MGRRCDSKVLLLGMCSWVVTEANLALMPWSEARFLHCSAYLAVRAQETRAVGSLPSSRHCWCSLSWIFTPWGHAVVSSVACCVFFSLGHLNQAILAFFGCLFVTLKGAWFLLLFGGFPDPCRHLICHLISCNYSCGVGDQIPFLVFPQGFL